MRAIITIMEPFALELHDITPQSVFAALHDIPYTLFLDSSDKQHYNARYSYIACMPIETLETKNGQTTITNTQSQTTYTANPFDILRDRMALLGFSEKTLYDRPPFQGGAAGLFGYDLGRNLETLPTTAAHNKDMIDMGIGIYDQVIAFDHKKGQSWLITHAKSTVEAAKKQSRILKILKEKTSKAAHQNTYTGTDLKWTSNFDQITYEQNVTRIIQHIREGDVFQANISQRFEAPLPDDFDISAHYMNLRRQSPSPFASYMNLGAIKIASASPEQFISLNDHEVTTRPIKGTTARSMDKQADKLLKETLLSSEKDCAENIMIVDLLRNDLSKSCIPDSVEVTSLCQAESFARVHHLVSTVRATLKDTKDALDLLRDCFPGGSITGAPKIRAMEIIEDIEDRRRGPYCGSIGYIGFNGAMNTNILIRTLVYEHTNKGHSVSFQVGGGITTDSDPTSEYQETLDKAKSLFKSFHSYIDYSTNVA